MVVFYNLHPRFSVFTFTIQNQTGHAHWTLVDEFKTSTVDAGAGHAQLMLYDVYSVSFPEALAFHRCTAVAGDVLQTLSQGLPAGDLKVPNGLRF